MSEQPDINEKLDSILKKIEASKADIFRSVDAKFAGLNENYARTCQELSKLKSEKDFVWKHEGHRIQYSFNSDTIDGLKQMKFALQYGKADYLSELLESEINRVEKRNKLIRIADTSEGGWETVREYEANVLADNSDDERRISRADTRAVKKLEKKKSKTFRFAPYSRPSATVTQSTLCSGVSSLSSPSQQPFRAQRRGTCFACGDPTHWRRDCPSVTGRPQRDSRVVEDRKLNA
ncbi:uncharacterized protein LOC124276631 [Haliotis rubra]|uniref:uncharacterized protein LOC124276631 n=1 Tax=Haliotis rubra TaxID=36100 RepID=UPI001EE523E5|nr:uncharacterized protein LOC124276631 [Haliotis rubra]